MLTAEAVKNGLPTPSNHFLVLPTHCLSNVVCGTLELEGGGQTTNNHFDIRNKIQQKIFFVVCGLLGGGVKYKSSFHKLQIIILVSGTNCSKQIFVVSGLWGGGGGGKLQIVIFVSGTKCSNFFL